MDGVHATLRLLATTDLHAHVLSWDYGRDRPRQGLGLAGLAGRIADARAQCPDALLFDNGDFLQGSALADWAVREGAGLPHPMIAAMNALGYDAATIGNHEFSHGMEVLSRALDQAAFPCVSANLHALDGGRFVRRGIVLERSLGDAQGRRWPIRIGVTGIAPAQTVIWEAARIAGRIGASEPIAAATDAVADLRRAGADVVVLLAHTGIGMARQPPPPADADPDAEGAALPLARLSGADAIVLGHAHAVFPAPDPDGATGPGLLHGRPAVMPGYFGSHLGQIDLDLALHEGRWQVGRRRVALIPTGGHKPADTASVARLDAACAGAHRATRAWLGRHVGQVTERLHSHFLLLGPSPVQHLIAEAQAAHARRALAEGPFADIPLLSAVAPARTNGRGGPLDHFDIAPGPVFLRDMMEVLPHPNTVVALLVTGAMIRRWLERAAILFAQLSPGYQDRPLLRADVPAFDLDMIAGLSFEIDLSQPPRLDMRGRLQVPAARRIRALRHRGRPVGQSDPFVLVTNSYRAAGSGGFFARGAAQVVLDDGMETRAALMAHLAAGRPMAAGCASGDVARAQAADKAMADEATGDEATGDDLAGGWRFRPLGGVPALIDLAPEAAPLLDEIAPLRPEPAGTTPEGMLRFRLWL